MTRDFDLGEVLSTGTGIYFKNFGTFVGLSLLVLSPAIVIEIAGALMGNVTGQLVTVGGQFLRALLQQIVTATIIFAVFRQLQGERSGVGEAISYALTRLLPVIAVSILVFILAFIGLILLIIPGLIVITLMFFAIPVCVVERPGIIASMERSVELTSGFRWYIFGLIVILFILQFGVSMVGGVLAFVNPTASVIVTALTAVLVTSFWACIQCFAYFRMREIKENLGIDAIAAAFE